MRELNLRPVVERVRPALAVTVHDGLPDAIDEAAANDRAEHGFLAAAWYRAASAGGATTLVARRPDGRVVAALPTEPIHRLALGGRAVPGCYWPYRGFPIAADISDEELAAFLADPLSRATLGPLWRLGPVREDDAAAARAVAAGRAAGWTVLRRRIATSFVLDVAELRAAGPWPRRSTLKKNRWFERQLGLEGALRFAFVAGADWSGEVFDTLARIEERSWLPARTDARDAKFLAPRHRRFWEGAARDPAVAARMQAAILYVGTVPAAFQFDLACGATRYAIANSYDARFARHSPGRVLCYRNFERLEAEGVRRIDWGAGDPGYKRTMGAKADAEIVDHLFVRSGSAAALVGRFW